MVREHDVCFESAMHILGDIHFHVDIREVFVTFIFSDTAQRINTRTIIPAKRLQILSVIEGCFKLRHVTIRLIVSNMICHVKMLAKH